MSDYRMDRVWLVLLALAATSISGVDPQARGDWPTWRYDAGRTAATPEELPVALRLQWQRELPRPSSTYPNDPRMCFDRSYEPVAAGQRLFLPSMVTDSVTALDVATGRPQWTFFAEGPVRFAPIVWQNQVYFTSDDGFLYCVGADDGRLRWRFSPMSAERRGLKLLGDERLISRWPARGGPVLADGTVYFAAGVWPFEGVAVCAVDARDGKPRWVNTSCHLVQDGLLDHGDRRDGGLSPQGYLTVLGPKLIVPSGRALPGVFDRATGRMEPYTSGWGGRVALAKGSWYVCGVGPWLFQSGDVYQVHSAAADTARPSEYVDIEDFARQVQVTPATLEAWIKEFKLEVVERDGRRQLHVRNGAEITYLSWWTSSKRQPLRPGEEQALATRTRLEIDPNNAKELGVFREPVLTEKAFYYSSPVIDVLRTLRESNADRMPPRTAHYTEIVACDLQAPPQPEQKLQGGFGQRLVAWRGARFQQRWSLPSTLKVHLKAGRRLYAGARGEIAAVEIPAAGGPATVAWRATIEGTPNRMLASGGRLFVVTLGGRLYCFGAGGEAEKRFAIPVDSAAPPTDAWTAQAAELLQTSGVREGYALALGIGTGRLVHELVRQSNLRVIVLEPDAEKADAARRRFFGLGLYGSRVHVLTGNLSSVHPAPYLASLVVAEQAPRQATSKGFVARLFSVLRPYGGKACLQLPADGHATWMQRMETLRREGAAVARRGELSILSRSEALPDSADWMHESGDAAHTYASEDRRVVPTLGVLWFGGGLDRSVPWVEGDPPLQPGEAEPSPFAGGNPRPRVAGGRMFVGIGDDLHVSDIYTGRPLWREKVDALGDFAASEDSVYVPSRRNCVRLDAATGRQLAVYAAPQGGTWRQVRIRGDALLASVGKALLCLDRRHGTVRWQRALDRDAASFAVARDRVFYVDYWSPAHLRREAPGPHPCDIVALQLSDGKLLWRTEAEVPATALPKPKEFAPPLPPQVAFSEASDVLVFTRNSVTAAAYRASTGELLWTKELPCKWPPNSFTSYHPPIVLADRMVTHGRQVIDLKTGQLCAAQLPLGSKVAPRGCGRALGCPHLVLIRDGHASYCDLSSGTLTYLRGIRSGCTNSLLPADGVLSAPNYSRHCNCNYPISTSLALVTMPEAADWDRDSWEDD
jgi:outer membrane protein assembly factor BamB